MKKLLLLATIALGLIGSPAFSSPVVVEFSFTNTSLYSGGLVTGRVIGLRDNCCVSGEDQQKASSVVITGNSQLGTPLGFGLGEYVSENNDFNSWRIVSGQVVNASFQSLGTVNAPTVTSSSLSFIFQTSLAGVIQRGAVLSNLPNIPNDGIGSGIDLTFTVTAVPVPAAGACLAIGLALMLGIGRRRRLASPRDAPPSARRRRLPSQLRQDYETTTPCLRNADAAFRG